MKTFKVKNNKGFTLIETLMSLLIFSVSIVALVSITAGGVSDTGFTKKKQTANLLAQEGIELVRYARDTTLRYPPADWNAFVTGMSSAGCMSQEGCMIDPYELAFTGSFSNAVTDCPGSCPQFNLNPNNGYYYYGPGDKTDYSRKITLEKVGGPNQELRAVSEVTWTHGNEDYSIEMSEVLSAWIQPIQAP